MRAHRLALAACALFAVGCNDDLAGATLVDGLRLLAVVAEPPEAVAGQTVALRAWAVDTHGGAIDIAWSACLLPKSGTLDPACITGSDGKVALGQGESISAVVPPFALDTLGPPDGTGSIYLPIVLTLTTPDDRVDAIYRLRVAGGGPPNRNPVLAAVEPFRPPVIQVAQAGDHLVLVPRFTGDSAEQYEIPDPEAAPGVRTLVQETLTVQWFATAGTFGIENTSALQAEPFVLDRRLPSAGGLIDVWAVGHDERGGTCVTHDTIALGHDPTQ